MATRVAIAQREERAIARLQAAAQEALAAAGVPEAFVLPTHKRPELRQAVRLEASADLAERLAEVSKPLGEMDLEEILARIEAIDGIGPKTMDLIRKGLAENAVEVGVELSSTDEGKPDDDSD